MKSLEERKADRIRRAAENAAEADVKPVHVEDAEAGKGKTGKAKPKTKAELAAEATAQAQAEADARDTAARGNGGGAQSDDAGEQPSAPANAWTPPVA